MIEGKKIEGYEGYIYGKDGNIYRLPFVSKGRRYPLRKIKFQTEKNRWRLSSGWVSKKMIEGILLMSKD
jgi:hypothetical protein